LIKSKIVKHFCSSTRFSLLQYSDDSSTINQMIRENFTQTPNVLFDHLLKELNNSELKIILVIIRQTNGWIDKKTDRRKVKDRITYSQFILKTGLSRRIISAAIKSLSQKHLIEITDYSGNILSNASERKGQYRIYYSRMGVPEHQHL